MQNSTKTLHSDMSGRSAGGRRRSAGGRQRSAAVGGGRRRSAGARRRSAAVGGGRRAVGGRSAAVGVEIHEVKKLESQGASSKLAL